MSTIIAVAAVIAGPLAPATAQAARPALAGNIDITMFSARGDPMGGGYPRYFDSADATITGTASRNAVYLQVHGPHPRLGWSLEFAAPNGHNFHPGYYTGLTRLPFHTPGRAGISITGRSNGCNSVAGSIDIRDIATSGSDITRLDLLYTQYCDTDYGALFGEVRIGEPGPAGLEVSSTAIAWPPTNEGGMTNVPVWIRNTSSAPVPVGPAELTGYDASEFALSKDGCSATSLAPGGACELHVGFEASHPGPASASLQLMLGSTPYTIQLDGQVPEGTTSLVLHSQPGDLIGLGRDYAYAQPQDGIEVTGTPTGLTASLHVKGDWNIDIQAPPLHVLRTGWAKVTQTNGHVLNISGFGLGCSYTTGWYRIQRLVFANGALAHLVVTFAQHCNADKPALQGKLEFQAEPVITPPAKVSRLAAVSTAQGLDVTWHNPSQARYAYTIVRIEPGVPVGVAPQSGLAAYAGPGDTTTVTGLAPGQDYTVVAFTVDRYGNVSAPTQTTVTG